MAVIIQEKMIQNIDMIKRFLIYGILGWALEISWTGLGSFLLGDWQLSGFTYLWMFPIYGLAVLLEPIHNKIRTTPWYFRGFLWVAIIFLIEYSTGYSLLLLLGRCPWDYSESTIYHVHGFIRLDYIPVWFVAGLLFEQIHKQINKILL